MKKKLGVVKTPKTPKTPKVEQPIAFDVFKANGMFVRSYDVATHGEKAEQWAKNFTAGTIMTYKPVFK